MPFRPRVIPSAVPPARGIAHGSTTPRPNPADPKVMPHVAAGLTADAASRRPSRLGTWSPVAGLGALLVVSLAFPGHAFDPPGSSPPELRLPHGRPGGGGRHRGGRVPAHRGRDRAGRRERDGGHRPWRRHRARGPPLHGRPERNGDDPQPSGHHRRGVQLPRGVGCRGSRRAVDRCPANVLGGWIHLGAADSASERPSTSAKNAS